MLSATLAAGCGAARVELCGAGIGGTTPSHALIARTRAAISVPLAVMIRPRTGDFCYDESELAVMHDDIEVARSLGADTIVFGVLDSGNEVDIATLSALVSQARPLPVTFHRAFDATPDPMIALDSLIESGVDRVLTSGCAPTALEGVDTLRRLHERAGSRLAVMAGGGVRAHNVHAVAQGSGVVEVHARATDPAVFAALMSAVR